MPASEEIEALRATLRDAFVRDHEPERLAAAIDRVKQLRCKEAVPDLVALISFRRPEPKTAEDAARNDIRIMTEFSWYPAMGALAEIGAPSADALSQLIVADDGRTQATANALSVLFQVFRYRPVLGADFLNALSQQVRSPDTAKQIKENAEGLRRLIAK